MTPLEAILGMAIVTLLGLTGEDVHNQLAALTRARAGNGLIASRLDTKSMIITGNGGTAGEYHAPRPIARATSTRVRGHSL